MECASHDLQQRKKLKMIKLNVSLWVDYKRHGIALKSDAIRLICGRNHQYRILEKIQAKLY
jgi:hypothetical protein